LAYRPRRQLPDARFSPFLEGDPVGLVASHSIPHLLVLARETLHFTQLELANAIGSSLRTVARWEADRSVPADFHMHRLAGLLFPVDSNLAHDAAFLGGKTLEELGLVKPAPKREPEIAPAPAPSPPIRFLVDAVVCSVAAALEAVQGAPVSLACARAAVAAAFTTARDLRLDLDAVAVAVAPKAPAKPAASAQSAETKARARRARE
jgi:transcriptional regulator with XRE-family HTH domain